MHGTKRYDGNLQMFCEPVHEVDLTKLRFLRWLIEQGKLEHPPFGEPAGEYAGFPPVEDDGLDLLTPVGADGQQPLAFYPDEQ